MKHIKKFGSLVIVGAAALGLQGCGSDDDVAAAPVVPATVTLDGVVADGPLS